MASEVMVPERTANLDLESKNASLADKPYWLELVAGLPDVGGSPGVCLSKAAKTSSFEWNFFVQFKP